MKQQICFPDTLLRSEDSRNWALPIVLSYEAGFGWSFVLTTLTVANVSLPKELNANLTVTTP